MIKRLVTGALLTAGFLTAGTASADLVFLGSHSSPPPGPSVTYNASTERGVLTCAGCEGALSSLASGVVDPSQPDVTTFSGWSATNADVFVLASHSPASETEFANSILGAGTVVGGVQTDMGGLNTTSFITSAMYVMFKIGSDPDVTLVRNLTGLAIRYTWEGVTGTGAGLSHITTWGGPPPVSVPEPHTALLLGAGLLAMALTRRRKKA